MSIKLFNRPIYEILYRPCLDVFKIYIAQSEL